MRKRIAIAAIFCWTGFVGGISFMEAWLKFRAPGITLPLGLGIGRLVFAALNKVEWVLWIVGLLCLLRPSKKMSSALFALLLVAGILLSQSFYLLPALDARAELYIKGGEPPHSNLHYYFIAAECIKVMLLLIAGIELFRTKRQELVAV